MESDSRVSNDRNTFTDTSVDDIIAIRRCASMAVQAIERDKLASNFVNDRIYYRSRRPKVF